MKVTAEHGENREVTLTIEVEQDKLEKASEGAAKRISARVNIPGFRKGKAPAGLLKSLSAKMRFCRRRSKDSRRRRLKML